MVPIFPPWKKSTLSTLLAYRAPAVRREARVAAVCGFPSRLRVCARQHSKSPRCTDVRKKQKIAIQQRDCDFERRRSGMDELSRSARKRRIWSLCRRRSQHRIWLVAAVPAARQMLFAGSSPHPLQQKRRKHEKRQTIQHPNSSTRSGNDTPKSSTSPYEPERLCDRVLSRKTHRDS